MSSLLHRLWLWLTGGIVIWPPAEPGPPPQRRLEGPQRAPEPPPPPPEPESYLHELYEPQIASVGDLEDDTPDYHPLAPPQRPYRAPPPPLYGPPPPKRPRAPRKPGQRAEIARLKTDILDQLGRYLVYIKRLKRWDKEAYWQYRRIGAFVMVGEVAVDGVEIEPVFLKTLPGFGALANGLMEHADQDPKGGKWIPARFAYFMKLDKPGHGVEHCTSGTTYRLQLYWDDDDVSGWTDNQMKALWTRRGHGFAGEYMVNISTEGEVRALRVLKGKPQVIRHKKDARGGASVITHQRWGIPKPPEGALEDGATPAECICHMFITLMNFWVDSAYNSMIRVTATKDGIVMPFTIDATKTPQFFADREPVVIDGITKRIFHVVRAHARNTAAGQKGVRLHFSGLRNFVWNGYDIQISVPGKEHLDVAEFNVGAVEAVSEAELKDRVNHLDYYEIGDWLADQIKAPAKAPRPEDADRPPLLRPIGRRAAGNAPQQSI